VIIHERKVGAGAIAEALQLQVSIEPPPRVLLPEQDHEERPREESPPAPASMNVDLFEEARIQVEPDTVPSTMRIGMATKIRKPVFSLLRGRSG
jgi:hypothetical protein